MLWGIYGALYGEVNVSVEKCVEIKGDYVEKYQNRFISVTLRSWSGRNLLDHTTYFYSRLFVRFPCMSTQHPALRCTDERILSDILGFIRFSWQEYCTVLFQFHVKHNSVARISERTGVGTYAYIDWDFQWVLHTQSLWPFFTTIMGSNLQWFWLINMQVRGSYRKSWATIFCKVTCFIIDKPITPP